MRGGMRVVDGGSVFSKDKILLHGDRVREYLTKGVTKAPVTLEIDLTNKCNNKCPNCTGYNSDSVEMDAGFAKSVIVDAVGMGVRGLIFTGGGEPLLHPNLAELVGFSKGVGLDVGVITSGQAPNSFTINDLVEVVKSASWLRVSLDAGSPERYKAMHGLNKNGYRNALNFIKDASEVGAEVNPSCTIGVGYLTGVDTLESESADILRSANECAVRGASYFQLRPLHKNVRLPLVDDGLVSKIEEGSKNPNFKFLGSAHKYDLFGKDDGKGSRSYDYCHGSRFASVVTADGYLTLCCHSRNQDWGRIVNLHDVSLSDAWSAGLVEYKTCGVDVHECVPYCRADNFNRTLESLTEASGNEHKNFL